jgi:hypothetical protein
MSSILLEAFKYSKLDLTDLIVFSSSGTSFMEQNFDIKPKDFLRFAKEDLKEGNERGYINSITNAKRAIDCQIDDVLEKLAFSSNNFTPLIKDFLKYYEFDSDITIKLQIIHALNLAPSLLISKSRTLRNKLEHLYQNPNIQEVKEALDVADLFLRSVIGKFTLVWNEFEFFDSKRNAEMKFHYEFLERNFILTVTINGLPKVYNIGINDIEYWGLLRLMLSIDDEIEVEETIKILVKQISHSIPLEKVKVYLSE